jgi:hypothetical protein
MNFTNALMNCRPGAQNACEAIFRDMRLKVLSVLGRSAGSVASWLCNKSSISATMSSTQPAAHMRFISHEKMIMRKKVA